MKSSKLISLSLLAVTICLMLPTHARASNDKFSSSEIKNLHFVSQAVLKSRDNEKKKVMAESAEARQWLQQVSESLHQLDGQLKEELMHPVLRAVNTSGDAMSQSAGNGVKSGIASDKLIKKIQNVRSKIGVLREDVESRQVSAWAFWQDKTDQDIRNDQVAEILSDVDKRLDTLLTADKLDIKSVEKIINAVELKGVDYSYEDIDPTFQTITQHRVRK